VVEIRIHGRGGQGAVIASKVLANAFFLENKFVQAFPAFGVERRGAPVVAFARVDTSPILLRCEIYNPDHLIVLDSALTETIDITSGLKPGGWIVINSHKRPEEFPYVKDYRVAVVDANAIAWKHKLGSRSTPIVNTAILGAFAKSTGLVNLDPVITAVLEAVPVNEEGNKRATIEAFEQTVVFDPATA
jgi:2-oxoisovalerate ferredoxin oxidoreductase gamma subunit